MKKLDGVALGALKALEAGDLAGAVMGVADDGPAQQELDGGAAKGCLYDTAQPGFGQGHENLVHRVSDRLPVGPQGFQVDLHQAGPLSPLGDFVPGGAAR